VPFEEAKHFARDQGIQFIETSARNGLNVERAFEIIAQEVSALKSHHTFFLHTSNTMIWYQKINFIPRYMIVYRVESTKWRMAGTG
jgi:Ras family